MQILYNYEVKRGSIVLNGMAAAFSSDVPVNKWYYAAVSWASANGIVSGVGNNKFDPESSITHEQLAKILYAYSGAGEYSMSLAAYSDAGNVSSWAVPAMKWAVEYGIISGMTNNGLKYLSPKGNATRAQAAAIFQRYIG